MANIRWLCEKINKHGLIPNSNDALKIEKRQFISSHNRSIELDEKQLEKITDANVKARQLISEELGHNRIQIVSVYLN